MNAEHLKNTLEVATRNLKDATKIKMYVRAEDNCGNYVNVEIASVNWGNDNTPALVFKTKETLVLKDLEK